MIAVLLLVSSGLSGAAALPHQPGEPAGIERYRRAETLVYSEQGSAAEIHALLEVMRRDLRGEPDAALRAYWISRTHLLLATHHNQQEESRAAQRELEAGFAAINDALERAGEFSDGLRVRADLHAQMMFARGLIYMARHGSDARAQALRAMELDPTNINARITAAGFYLNAPGFAGGDREEGTRILESALAQGPENDNERFLILGLLAQTYGEAGDTADAGRYLQLAEEIHPRSPWIAELRSTVGS